MTTVPPTPPTDDDLQALAEQFVDALLSSADVGTIGATHWWDRAKTALETGAASSTTWPQCVSRAARKLQIETLSGDSAKTIATMGTILTDPAAYTRWARLAARDAIYTVAIVRAQRDTCRTARKPKPEPAPKAPVLTFDVPEF